MSKRAKIISCSLPGPYNLLELSEGETVTICIKRIEEGYAVREAYPRGKVVKIEGKILRCYTDIHTPVRGLHYLDILSGKAIALVKSLFEHYKQSILVRFTAHGQEPDKWYEVELLGVGC